MPLHPGLEVEVPTIRVNCGVLDGDTAEVVADEVSRMVNDTGPTEMRLDLGDVTLLTAAALSKLISLHADLHSQGWKLTFCNVPGPLHEVFQVTGLTRFLDIRPALVE